MFPAELSRAYSGNCTLTILLLQSFITLICSCFSPRPTTQQQQPTCYNAGKVLHISSSCCYRVKARVAFYTVELASLPDQNQPNNQHNPKTQYLLVLNPLHSLMITLSNLQSNTTQNICIHSFIYVSFVTTFLVRVLVDPEPIPVTLGAKLVILLYYVYIQ